MQPTYSNSTPVNGVLILILGILSILGIPILGPVAWIMGNKGLEAIDRGGADFQQRQNTVIGRICGIIGTVLLILGVLGFIAYTMFFSALIGSALRTQGGAAISPAVNTGAHVHFGVRHAAPGYGDLAAAVSQSNEAKIKAIAHKYPAALNSRNAQGETPLFQAVTEGKPAMAGLLLRLGANVNARDLHGATALDKARTTGKDDVLAVLVSHGGKP